MPMTNIEYVQSILNAYRNSPETRWLGGMPFYNGEFSRDANLANQYMQLVERGYGTAPSWEDFSRLTNRYTPQDIFRGTAYDSTTGAPIQIDRTPNHSGSMAWDGGVYTFPTASTQQPTGNPPTSPSYGTPPTAPQPGTGSPLTGAPSPPSGNPPGTVTVNPGTVPGTIPGGNPYTPTSSAPGYVGGWNIGAGAGAPTNGGGLLGNPNSPFGTAPQQLSGKPWQLGGSFGGTFMPVAVARGYDDWSANNPRAQNPGAVSFTGGNPTNSGTTTGGNTGGGNTGGGGGGSGGQTNNNERSLLASNGGGFSPRNYVDFYGTGLQFPYNNMFQQWGLSTLNQTVQPTFGWAQPRAPRATPSLFGGLLGNAGGVNGIVR